MPVDCPFDVTADTVLAALTTHDGPVLVDLDETLYLRNSTEDFIDLARPALLAVFLLRLLDLIKPWRFTGGDCTRDVWRVRLISTVFPWTWGRWRRRVAALADAHCNQALGTALKALRVPPTVLTSGFRPVVTPLIAALGFADSPVIAARLDSFEDRGKGKLFVAVSTLGNEAVAKSLVITDSIDDLPLLQACAKPLRSIWPAAHFRRAHSGTYLPTEYLNRVKRPGERYLLRVILPEDLAFWVLASVGLAAHPLPHVVGISLLLASFWIIYERGYVDNDLVAAQYETDPKLSADYWKSPVATPRWQPWIWSLAIGALGVFLIRWPDSRQLDEQLSLDFGKWTLTLLVTYWCFLIYNRVNKPTRIWLFAGLQVLRSAAFIVLVPVLPIAAVCLAAHVLARWVPYYLYRMVSRGWLEAGTQLIRLLFYVVIGGLLAATQGASLILNWTALALLLWNIFRGRAELWRIVTGASRIDHDSRAA